MFILTEVEASALNCGHNVLDVRVVQVERESWQLGRRRNSELNLLPTLLPIILCLSETEMSVLYMPWYIWHIILVSNEVSMLPLLMPTSNYPLPLFHTCRRWEAKLVWDYWPFISFPPPTHFAYNPWTVQRSHADLSIAHFIAWSYKKPLYLIACGYLCQFSAVLVKRRWGEVFAQTYKSVVHTTG